MDDEQLFNDFWNYYCYNSLKAHWIIAKIKSIRSNLMHSYMEIIIIDQHIHKVRGNITHLLGIDKEMIYEGLSFFDIPWEEIVSSPPILTEEAQLIKSIKGNNLYIRITNIPKEIKDNSYIITIIQLDVEDVSATNLKGISVPNQTNANRSSKMQKIMQIIDKISNVDSTVLLLGETGVGKTWLAKYIHKNSSRNEEPFVSINCSTLPDSLIESELFGYEAGTFTGGNKKGKEGLLNTANNGIVFLDEIGELPLATQSKLLEVLQDGTFRKIGGSKNIKVNIRVIAATNRDLDKMVQEKEFREDLYYRLYVVPLVIPALRERLEEIPFLANEFLQIFNGRYQQAMEFNQTIMQELLTYSWPGNIRELENTIERYVVTQTFPNLLSTKKDEVSKQTSRRALGYPSLKEAKRKFEKQLITEAYEELGTTYKVAEALGVNQSTIAKKVKQYRKESEKDE